MISENDLNKLWENFRLEGSQEALSLIYYGHFDFLYDFALRYTGDRSLIEDSIQNVFGYLLRKQKKLNPVSNLRYYLLQSFRRELFDQLKKKKRIHYATEFSESPELLCYNKIEDQIESEERDSVIKLVQKSIAKLGPKQQEIIFLRFSQDFDYSEIAEMLSISVDSCYQSVYRSVKFIKEDIEKTLGDNPNLLLWVYIGLKKIKKN
ncbi:MAG: sigma-70 family RNA polymerase sigma factor [Deltaproteobacteria bacterium]|nr:sigma-70 family RNA polymerase sigma factor [Deltaproteobacteria bacterium]